MTLRATTHLAVGANELFDQWIEALRLDGVDIDSARGDDSRLDGDLVFACGLLTATRVSEGAPLEVIGAPVFEGETEAVYRSVIVARHDSNFGSLQAPGGLRLAVNEYGSWSGWHGFNEHLRHEQIDASAIGEHVLTGGHVNSIRAVLDGDADIASIDHSVWDSRRSADPRLAELRIIATTRDWPAPPLSVRTSVAPDVRKRLTSFVSDTPTLRPTTIDRYTFMCDEADNV